MNHFSCKYSPLIDTLAPNAKPSITVKLMLTGNAARIEWKVRNSYTYTVLILHYSVVKVLVRNSFQYIKLYHTLSFNGDI